MSDNTKIEWADATVNAVNGCSVVSPGCTNCYAMRLAGTRMKHHPTREGLTVDTKAGPVWNGEVRLHEAALLQPLRWKRPRQIFWNAHGDLFHPAVPDAWIDRVFAVCALTPQHTHMILTKRPARMRKYMTEKHRNPQGWPEEDYDVQTCIRLSLGGLLGGRKTSGGFPDMKHFLKSGSADRYGAADKQIFDNWPLPNVWLGVSVEDQQRANERIPDLLATPAWVRFLSCEPLLGEIDLLPWFDPSGACCGGEPEYRCKNCPSDAPWRYSIPADDGKWLFDPTIDWVIAGGESGPSARPMHPDWARSLRDQCAAAGVPFHFKQWGEFVPCISDDEGHGLRCHPDGADCDAFFAETKALIVTAHDREFWRIGKKRAGRLLDGVEHNGMPTPPSSPRT